MTHDSVQFYVHFYVGVLISQRSNYSFLIKFYKCREIFAMLVASTKQTRSSSIILRLFSGTKCVGFERQEFRPEKYIRVPAITVDTTKASRQWQLNGIMSFCSGKVLNKMMYF